MKTRLFRNISSALLVSSVILVSACATTSEEMVSDKAGEINSEGSRRAKIEAESTKSGEENTTATVVNTDKAGSRQKITAKILQKMKRVKISSVASNRGRCVGHVKGGTQIEVLEEKGRWLKIRWETGDQTKNGWLKKQYVDLTH